MTFENSILLPLRFPASFLNCHFDRSRRRSGEISPYYNAVETHSTPLRSARHDILERAFRTRKRTPKRRSFSVGRWQLPILPGSSPSTFGVRELNFCVRDGNRWILSAIVTTMVYKALFSALYHGLSPRFPPPATLNLSLPRLFTLFPLSVGTNKRSTWLRRLASFFTEKIFRKQKIFVNTQIDNYTAKTQIRFGKQAFFL